MPTFAVLTLDFDVSADSVTFEGTTFRGDEQGTSVTVAENGTQVTPSQYGRQEADRVRIVGE